MLFKDANLWSEVYEVILNQKKKQVSDLRKNKKKKTFLNPLRVVRGIQSMIVRKRDEEDLQTEVGIKNESLELLKFYLSNLELNLDFSTEIMKEIAIK